MKKYLIIFIALVVILILGGCEKTDPLQDILDSIEIPTEVTTNLDLKSEYSLNGVSANASWHSIDSTVISSDGQIVVTTEDKTTTLQLKLFLDGRAVSKNFLIVVKGNSDLLVLFALYNDQLKNMDKEITEDLNLASTYIVDGKTVEASWTSSNEAAISSTGKVTRSNFNVEVLLEVTLKLNLAERKENFLVKVMQKEDSLPVNFYHLAPVHLGIVADEALKPSAPSCFAGAIYRKVFSSRDYWLGIEATITLGEFTPDPLRYDASRASYWLDNPSVYMGGNARNESDIGLTWSIGHTSATNTAITKMGIAYRPFWRYITSMETGKRENIYKNAPVGRHEFYYYPGDKIRMSVFSPTKNYMQMRIELLELTTIPKYVMQRAEYNLGDDFERIFTTDPFPSEGMGIDKTEFKRVNAIDQVANEGKATINTNAKVENAIWHEVYLYRKINDDLFKVPMNDSRTAKMACPVGRNANGDFSNTFKLSDIGVDKELGGEVISLMPNNGTGKLYNSFNQEIIIIKNPYEVFL